MHVEIPVPNLVLGLSANKSPGAGAAGAGRGSPRALGSGGQHPPSHTHSPSLDLGWAQRLHLRGGGGGGALGKGSESQVPGSLPPLLWVAWVALHLCVLLGPGPADSHAPPLPSLAAACHPCPSPKGSPRSQKEEGAKWVFKMCFK